MENRSFTVEGIPLTKLGLQCAVVVHKDGHREPLRGFVVPVEGGYRTRLQVVPAWRPNHRPATHTHRVLGHYAGFRDKGVPAVDSRPIVTLVWRGKDERKWGFLKHRDGRWCWVHWKSYVFGGGKSAPCE